MNARIFPVGARLVLAAALALGATACAGNLDKAGNPDSRPLVLTLADGNGDTSDAQPFAAAVWKLSHGSIQIKIDGGWRPSDAYYETGLIKDVRAGKAAMGIVASRAFDTVGITSFQALQAPFLIDSQNLERKVLSTSIPAKMLARLRPYGLAGLGVLPGPLRRPFGVTRPLLAASDYKGARIAIRPSGVTADIVRALGAVPVAQQRSNSGEINAGLTGVEAHAVVIDTGFAVPHAVLTGNVVFGPRPNVIFMNQRAYASLTARQRGVLLRAAAEARDAGIYQGNDAAAVADLCRRGIKIMSASPAEVAGLRAAVQPVYRKLESSPPTKAFINQIAAMRRAVGGSPGAVTCPTAGTGGIASNAAALQGSWQVTYTEAEFAAAGAYPGELLPSEGNWGHETLTFANGRWREVARPSTAPAWTAYGTYIVTGHQITMYRHDRQYPGSNTEIWGPYTWSVYKDTLTFVKAALAGMEIPTGLVVKPWRGTGALS